MNRERAAELLPIIEAFANGEDVQINGGGDEWSTFTIFEDGMGPDWSDDCVYRIKPKPREFWLNTVEGSIHDPDPDHPGGPNSQLDSRWVKVIEVL